MELVSGPKYCGQQTTEDPHTTEEPIDGEMESLRVIRRILIKFSQSLFLKIMSYNVYGWNAFGQNPWKAENVYKAIRQVSPDILGAQECQEGGWLLAENIGTDYSVAERASAGHAIIYRTSVLTFQGYGETQLNEMDHWGPVSFHSHHGSC